MKSIIRCWKIIFKHAKGYFFTSILGKAIGFAKVYFLAWVGRDLVNALSASIVQKEFLWRELLLAISLMASGEILVVLVPKLLSVGSAKTLLCFRTKMSADYYATLYSFGLSVFDDPKDLNSIRQAARDQDSIIHIFDHTCSLVLNVLSFFVAFLIAIELNPLMAVLIILFTTPNFFVKRKIKKANYESEKELNLLNRKSGYYGSVFANKSTFREMKIFDAKEFFLRKFIYCSMELNDEKEKLIKKHAAYDIFMGIFFVFVNVFMNGFMVYNIVANGLTIGDFGYYTSILTNIKSTFNGFVDEVSTLMIEVDKIRNYSSFCESDLCEPSGGLKLPDCPCKIEFKNVSFRYPNSQHFVIKNVSFCIPPSGRVAFAGLNGAGKTTLISLLLRFYEPTEGEILIDGVRASDYDLPTYRKHFSPMFQESTAYALPLIDNLFLGMPPKDENEIVEVLRNLSLPFDEKSFTKEIGKSFDENGEMLSYGQIQKMCFARTLMKDGDVYILDEPSASLDPYSEHAIFETILNAVTDKTLILVSHRLSNLKSLDRIFFFENGELVEDGAHDELVAKKGKYAQLYMLQAAGYL